MMKVVVGVRVVRGPGWAWGDQDGGSGYLGTVVEVHKAHRPRTDPGEWSPLVVTIQWDCGNRCRYRCGIAEKYDLKVYDSAPAGVRHTNVVCDSCGMENVTGLRWKCVRCYEFDLCTLCYMSGKHSLEHEFDRMDTKRLRTRIPARMASKRREVRGIFAFAEVVPGHDWDSRAGRHRVGRVTSIHGDDSNPHMRSIAEVEWETGEKSHHRVGLQGKVDLKCTDPSSGGYYYPEHLPLLGAPPPASNPEHISAGDLVRVELEPDVFKAVQEGHGGWNEKMMESVGKLGTVIGFKDTRDLCVQYPNHVIWPFCLEAVVKVDVPRFRLGDAVLVDGDMARVRKLQRGYYEGEEIIALMIGEIGRVLQVTSGGDVIVAIKGRTWAFNPLCLSLADEGERATPTPALLAFKQRALETVQMSLLRMLEAQSPELVFGSCLASDTSLLRTYLQEHPEQVNAQSDGMSGLHCAASTGNVPVLKVLLEFGADVETRAERNGNTPLHVCSSNGHKEIAQLLIDAGADVNATNATGLSSLMMAAMGGQRDVAKLLANQPHIKLDEQDQDGNTALHSAVLGQKTCSVTVLLDAGADPTLVNFSLYTAIHDATRVGFLPAMEKFMACYPEHVNLRSDYAYTPLHTAALYGLCDIVTLLAETRGCDIDSKNDWNQTPLHVAIIKGYTRIVDKLVGYGASVNAQDLDGHGCLHVLLTREGMDPPNDDTPKLKKMHTVLFGDMLDSDSPRYCCTTVAVFLMQQGADIHLASKRGHTPLQMCPNLTMLMAIAAENAERFETGEPPSTAKNGVLRVYSYKALPQSYRTSRTGQASTSGDGYMGQHGAYSEGEGYYGEYMGGGGYYEGGVAGGGYSGGSTRDRQGYGYDQATHSQYGRSRAYGGDSYGRGTQQGTSGRSGSGSTGQGSDGYPTCQTAYLYGPSGGIRHQASYGYGGTTSTYGTTTGKYGGTAGTYGGTTGTYGGTTGTYGGTTGRSTGSYGGTTSSYGGTASAYRTQATDDDYGSAGYYQGPSIDEPPTITPLDDNDPAPSPSASGSQPSPQVATPSQDPPSSSALEAKTTPPEENDDPSVDMEGLCFLCDKVANVTFSPCGHSSMCAPCASRAKRCPVCRTPVGSLTKNGASLGGVTGAEGGQ